MSTPPRLKDSTHIPKSSNSKLRYRRPPINRKIANSNTKFNIQFSDDDEESKNDDNINQVDQVNNNNSNNIHINNFTKSGTNLLRSSSKNIELKVSVKPTNNQLYPIPRKPPASPRKNKLQRRESAYSSVKKGFSETQPVYLLKKRHSSLTTLSRDLFDKDDVIEEFRLHANPTIYNNDFFFDSDEDFSDLIPLFNVNDHQKFESNNSKFILKVRRLKIKMKKNIEYKRQKKAVSTELYEPKIPQTRSLQKHYQSSSNLRRIKPKEPNEDNFKLHFFSDDLTNKLPTSFVPYYSKKRLQNLVVTLNAKGYTSYPALNCSSYDPFRKTDDVFPLEICDYCKEIKLSDIIPKSSFSSMNVLGNNVDKLGTFPFISEKLFPFDTNVKILTKKLKGDDKEELNDNDILAFAKTLFPKYLNPYNYIDFKTIPIYSNNIKVKSNENILLRAYLFSNKFVCGNTTIEITSETKVELSSPKGIRILNNNSDTCYFYECNDESEARFWVNSIESLANNTNVEVINLHLFILSSYEPSLSIEEKVVSAITSPIILFSLTLLNHEAFDKNYILSLFNILKAKSRHDFFIRSLLLAEFSFKSHEKLFQDLTDYSEAFINLFSSVSNQWLSLFADNIINNKITNSDDLLTLFYSLFSLIDNDGFYMIRCLILYSCALCPSKHHPLIPFFNFLKTSLNQFHINFDCFNDLLNKLKAYEFVNQKLSELVPFTIKIVQNLPKIQSNKNKVQEQAGTIYQFLINNCSTIIPKLTEKAFSENIESQNPITLSYYQNLIFLLRHFH